MSDYNPNISEEDFEPFFNINQEMVLVHPYISTSDPQLTLFFNTHPDNIDTKKEPSLYSEVVRYLDRAGFNGDNPSKELWAYSALELTRNAFIHGNEYDPSKFVIATNYILDDRLYFDIHDEGTPADIENIGALLSRNPLEVLAMCAQNTAKMRDAEKNGEKHNSMGLGLHTIVNHPNISLEIRENPKVFRINTPFVR